MAGLRAPLRTLRCRPRGRAHARLGADVDRYSVRRTAKDSLGSTMIQWPRLGSRQVRREAAWPSMPATSSMVSVRP